MFKNKEEISSGQFMQNLVTKLFLVAMLGIFPLIYKDGYLNISYGKVTFFQLTSIIFIVLIICFSLLRFVKERKQKIIKLNVSVVDVCILIFAVVVIVSSFTSTIGADSFWGSKERRLNGFVLLLCAGVYFCISRFYESYQALIWIFLLANVIQFILLLFNYFHIDPLQMYATLDPNQHASFMGTMGNININAGYISVVLAIIMALFYQSNLKFSENIYLAVLFLGFLAAYATHSQSWVLGVGAGAFVLFWYTLGKPNKIIKIIKLWSVFLGASIIVKISSVFLDLNLILNDGLFKLLLDSKFLLLQAVFIIIAFVFAPKYKIGLKKAVRIGILVIGAMLAVIIFNRLFPLDDNFGAGRGYIWKRTLWTFQELPLWNKLFGYGASNFYNFINISYGGEMRELYGSPFYDAHNDILQFLAITGISGVLTYMGAQVMSAVHCIKKCEAEPAALVGIAGICAYAAQGLVNNPLVFTTPLLFVFLGIIEGKMRNKNELTL